MDIMIRIGDDSDNDDDDHLAVGEAVGQLLRPVLADLLSRHLYIVSYIHTYNTHAESKGVMAHTRCLRFLSPPP